jgi:hypothetical protein
VTEQQGVKKVVQVVSILLGIGKLLRREKSVGTFS